jgi:hypothetical protein
MELNQYITRRFNVMKISNKVFISIFTLLIVLFLSACKSTEPSEKNIMLENEQQNISYSFNNPNTGQEFNKIHAYLLYEEFFESVRANPDQSPYQLYQQVVIEPVFDACFKDAEYLSFNFATAFEWTPEEKEFHSIMNQIDSIDKDQLNKVFEESLVKSSDILPSNKKNNCMCVS